MSLSSPLRSYCSRQSSVAAAAASTKPSAGVSLSSPSLSLRPATTTRTIYTTSGLSRCRYLSSSSRSHAAARLKASDSALRRRSSNNNNNGNSHGRWMSTDAGAAAPAPANPKIAGIVDQISQLTLLETADLVASLKSRLNIPDMSFASGASSAAPAATAPAPVEEEEAAPAPQEKSLFTLKLQSFEAASKPKIIKEVKSMLGLSLVDSKKFVESAPKMLKEGVPKEEAEKIVALLKGLGGVVVME